MDMLRISAVADMQFGKGASEALFSGKDHGDEIKKDREDSKRHL